MTKEEIGEKIDELHDLILDTREEVRRLILKVDNLGKPKPLIYKGKVVHNVILDGVSPSYYDKNGEEII